MARTVMVSGGFDPPHFGHLSHFLAAKKLGNYLIVALNTDEFLLRKKGYIFMPYEERLAIIKEFRCVDEVVQVIDQDQTVAETLRHYKPAIFAKGGDRIPINMPNAELKACEEIGCKIVYGVNGEVRSSQYLTKRAALNLDKAEASKMEKW